MSPLSRIGFLLAAVLIAGWLYWLTNTLLDLREWTEKALTGRQHGEPAAPDAVDEALRRFSFGGGNDGRNFALSDARTDEGMRGYPGGTESGSERPTRHGNGNSEEARPHGE